MDNGRNGALVGDATFNSFWNQLFCAPAGVLKIAIRGTLSLSHGAQGTHPPICLVGSTLVQLNLSWRLLRTGEHTPHHDRVCTGHDRLGDVPGESDATVCYERNIGPLEGLTDVSDGRDLGNAGSCHNSGGADRAGTDAHLDTIHASLRKSQRCSCRRNIATNDLHGRKTALDEFDRINHVARMSVGGIHNQHIDASRDQSFRSLGRIRACTHGCPHPQLTIGILAGVGKALGFVEVFYSNHATQIERVINNQNLFNAVSVQQLLHLPHVCALLDRDQLVLASHYVGDRFFGIGLKPHIATGNDTHQILAIQHR